MGFATACIYLIFHALGAGAYGGFDLSNRVLKTKSDQWISDTLPDAKTVMNGGTPLKTRILERRNRVGELGYYRVLDDSIFICLYIKKPPPDKWCTYLRKNGFIRSYSAWQNKTARILARGNYYEFILDHSMWGDAKAGQRINPEAVCGAIIEAK